MREEGGGVAKKASAAGAKRAPKRAAQPKAAAKKKRSGRAKAQPKSSSAQRPSRRRPVGRPTKRDAKVEKKILKLLGEVGFFKLTADLVGLNRDTLLQWRKEDPDFDQRCRTARAGYLLRVLERLVASDAPGAWAKERWLLQVTEPSIFGDLAADDGLSGATAPVKVLFSVLPAEE